MVFGQKITRKLTLVVFAILVLLTGAAITAQFFFVSRFYVTTDYTRQRIETIRERSEEMEERGLAGLQRTDTAEIQVLLDRFGEESNACCLLLDSVGGLLCQSSQAEQLDPAYLNYARELLKSGEIYDYDGRIFRIQNAWRFPSRYVGMYQTICLSDWQTEGVAYLIVITREVYTAGDYGVFRNFTLVFFGITVLVSCTAAILIARRVTRPVLRMEATARRMSNLDFSEKCDVTGRDELGDLARSLNFLSEKLESSIGQLQQANRALQEDLGAQQELDRMRRNFIASASHEFKTPLTLLRGYLEMMRDQVLPPQAQREAEDTMIEEIDRLDQLVLDMLELSRLESESQPMKMAPFSLNQLLNRCVRQFSEAFRTSYIELRLVAPSDECTVWGDKEGIEHVLTNFLSNAWAHTPEGGTVELRVEPQEEAVKIAVFNQGEPIPQESLSLLWDPFYRTDRSRAKHSSGTGLGLAICREILEQHGCGFGVENTRDGVVFFFIMKSEAYGEPPHDRKS